MAANNVADATASMNEEDPPAATTYWAFEVLSQAAVNASIAQQVDTVEPLSTLGPNSAPSMLYQPGPLGAQAKEEEHQYELDEDAYESSELSDEEAIEWEDTYDEIDEDYGEDDDEDEEDDGGSVDSSSLGHPIPFDVPPHIIAAFEAEMANVSASVNSQSTDAPQNATVPDSAPTNEGLSAQEAPDAATATSNGASNVAASFATFLTNYLGQAVHAHLALQAEQSAASATSASNVPTTVLPGVLASQLITPTETMLNPLNATPLYPFLGFLHEHRHRRPRFNAAAYVATLEEVDISTIPAADMKCPFCWLPFGTTDEDDPAFVYTPDPDEVPELSACQTVLRVLPFREARPDNDPVRTPCGHIFGRGCLIESLEKVDTLCPTCRRDLRPKVAGPQPALPVLQSQGGGVPLPFGQWILAGDPGSVLSHDSAI